MNKKPGLQIPTSDDLDVMLDPGHGGTDPGVSVGTVHEKTEALEMALTLKYVLTSEYGLKVGLTRTSDVYPPLLERTRAAERAKAEVFVSVHYDIATPGWRYGAYHDGKTSSKDLAFQVAKALDPINGTTGVWVRSHTESRFGRLYIADFSRGPSILIEFGPIRNVEAEERLKYARAVAPVIARAVAKEQA